MRRGKNIRFKRGDRVLKGVSLSIEVGEIVVVAGPNGSGKTTLGMIMAGLWEPHRGSVEADGEHPKGKVYVAFQDARLPDLSVEEYLKLVGDLELLEPLGLREFLKRSCRKLSIGQKRRVHLQAAYSSRHKYVVLDEPEAGIDSIDLVKLVLGELKKRKGVLLITHEPELAKLADRIYRLRAGKLYEDHHTREDVL